MRDGENHVNSEMYVIGGCQVREAFFEKIKGAYYRLMRSPESRNSSHEVRYELAYMRVVLALYSPLIPTD